MTSQAKSPPVTETDRTLTRLYRLVETSGFEDEEERSEILRRLYALKQEMMHGPEGESLPESFHAALQHTETFAISRLGDDTSGSEDLELSWNDFRKSLRTAIERWEGMHPKLAAAFMDLTSALSKLGI
jgi:hypothetical protein